MSESEKLRKRELECLRLASDCRQLARDVPEPALKSHFARMAGVFEALAVDSPQSLQLTDSPTLRNHRHAVRGKKRPRITPAAALVED